MNLKIVRGSIFRSNDSKYILDSVSPFGLARFVDKNLPLYFYPYDAKDLIEVSFAGENINVDLFTHSSINAEQIVKNHEAILKSYHENGIFKNKRFLFSLSLGIAVRYADFTSQRNLDNFGKDICFVTRNDDSYVTGCKSVAFFSTGHTTPNVDVSVLALFNNLKHIFSYSILNKDASILMTLLSGMLADVSPRFMELSEIGVESRLFGLVNGVDFDDFYMESFVKQLDVDKFKELLTSTKDPVNIDTEIKDDVRLTEIIEHGLNPIIRRIKDVKKIIHVELDYPLAIKDMYIQNGAAFVLPGDVSKLEEYRELFQSESVVFILG